jgi:hypothetical protein
MAKFLLVYRDVPPTQEPSAEQMQAILGEWMAWIGKFQQSGHMVDAGDGLKPAGKLIRQQVVHDGPFAESKEILGGYSVIQAANWDEALSVAKECPAAAHGSIEIRELAGY